MNALRRRLCLAGLGLTLGPAALAHGRHPVQHALTWPQLLAMAGRYPSDRAVAAHLQPVLRRLLGRRLREFSRQFAVQSPISVADQVACLSGMLPHSGGERAAFAFLARNGQALAVLKAGSRFEYFGAKALRSVPAVADCLAQFERPS